MNMHSFLEHGLNHARNYTLALLDDFQSDRDWMTTVNGSQNHALWIIGHLTIVDNSLLGYINHTLKLDLGNFQPLFGKGSTPSTNRSDYPEIEDLLSAFRLHRQRVIDTLHSLSEAQLAEPTLEAAPPFLPLKCSVFQILSWHEGLHSGQLSQIHRTLGHKALR